MNQSRIITIKDAVAKLRRGMSLGLSGFSYMNPPMSMVREIIRTKLKDLTLISGPTSGIETDLLIGAGCVKKVVTACVAFEKIAGVGPNFKKAAEKGSVEIWECDESMWHLALKAARLDMPYLLWRGGLGTSIPKLNKDIKQVWVNGKAFLKIPPIHVDMSFIHAGMADEWGNVQFPANTYLGRLFCEQELAECAKETVCSVEHLVDNKHVRANAHQTIMTNAWIIESPCGAHPGASNGFYVPDLGHYREYVKFCREGKFQSYLEKYVFGPVSEREYQQLVGHRTFQKLRLTSAPNNGKSTRIQTKANQW